jgi:hypothetical protein
MIANGSRWKHHQRSAAILAAIREGLSPQAVANQYGVPLRAVLALCNVAEQRELFARERAESGGWAHVRTLGREEDVCR